MSIHHHQYISYNMKSGKSKLEEQENSYTHKIVHLKLVFKKIK